MSKPRASAEAWAATNAAPVAALAQPAAPRNRLVINAKPSVNNHHGNHPANAAASRAGSNWYPRIERKNA